jgi:N-acetyl-anhydromuramyl-L-alanine amidase AmpD
MIGTNKFTQAQWDSLKLEVLFLASELGIQTIQGHRDLSPDKDGDGVLEKHEWLKDCPGFDVAEWIKNGYTPNKLNVLKK